METNEIINNEELVDEVVTAIPEVMTTNSGKSMKVAGAVLLATAIVGGGIYLVKKLRAKKKAKDDDNSDSNENTEDCETVE